MKEKLLKYGISIDLLSKQELDDLDVYISDIKEGNLTPFHNFEKSFCETSISQKQKLENLYRSIMRLINRATNLTEASLPDSNRTLLVSFGNQYSTADFEKKHIELLINISSLNEEINAAVKACNDAVSGKNDTMLTELALRYIALSEISPNSALLKLYEPLYKSREKLSSASHIHTAEDYSKLIILFETETKKFCLDADKAYQGAKNHYPSITDYYRVLRQYISLLHQISLKADELQGGKNAKI